MEPSNNKPNGNKPSSRWSWLRMLQALAKGSGPGQRDSEPKQSTSRVSEISAEQKRLEREVMENFVPPCPNRVREIATAAFHSIPDMRIPKESQ